MRKLLRTKEDCQRFLAGKAGRLARQYLVVMTTAVSGMKRSDCPPVSNAECESSVPLHLLQHVELVLLPAIEEMAMAVPLEDMKQQRFGNIAFRKFHAELAVAVKALLQPIVTMVLPDGDSSRQDELQEELACYLCDSVGNPQRIDYGTGHELHFHVFTVVCLHRLGVDAMTETVIDQQRRILQVLALRVFLRYIRMMRAIQQRYSLEPAGSHGVWGLDDYHHIPFLLGASQLEGKEEDIAPKHITDRAMVDRYHSEYVYFEMILWILTNKHGPFHEHSNMLYNISGLQHWERLTRGLLKMYDGEVLTKWNVIQHFWFGPTLTLESD